MELLESRRLASATLIAGTLTIVGTPQDDHIQLTHPAREYQDGLPIAADTSITLLDFNGQQYTYDQPILRIIINAGAGDDYIKIGQRPAEIFCRVTYYHEPLSIFEPVPTLIRGGDGADTIIGSTGPDIIFGGRGDDSLQSIDGNDHIHAGPGDDNVYGGPGNDFLSGGDGTDWIRGGSGNDHLAGNFGDDFLEGETGNDTMIGNAGNDGLSDHDGRNVFRAGRGDDGISVADAHNRLSGGPGQDVLHYLVPPFPDNAPLPFKVPSDIERTAPFRVGPQCE